MTVGGEYLSARRRGRSVAIVARRSDSRALGMLVPAHMGWLEVPPDARRI